MAIRAACDATVAGSSNGILAYILPPGSWHGAQRTERIGRSEERNAAAEAAGIPVGSGPDVDAESESGRRNPPAWRPGAPQAPSAGCVK